MKINDKLRRYNEFLQDVSVVGGPDEYTQYLYDMGFRDGAEKGFNYALDKIGKDWNDLLSDIQWDAYFTGRNHQLKKDQLIVGVVILIAGGVTILYMHNKPRIDKNAIEIKNKVKNKIQSIRKSKKAETIG